jgi:hypothetical protein
MLSAIHHATQHGPAEGVSVKRGHRWAVTTTHKLRREYLPHWSASTVVRVLKSLRGAGVLVVGQDRGTDSKTLYFRVDYKALGSRSIPSPQWIKTIS